MSTTPQIFRSALDALTEHIAILDQTGTILAVNAAWKHYAELNGYSAGDQGIGLNYLEICDRASGAEADSAHKVAHGIRQVSSRAIDTYVVEYPCHSPTSQYWYEVHITRIDAEHTSWTVVAHHNVTDRKRAELFDQDRRHVLELVAQGNPLHTTLSQIRLMAQHRFPTSLATVFLLHDQVLVYDTGASSAQLAEGRLLDLRANTLAVAYPHKQPLLSTVVTVIDPQAALSWSDLSWIAQHDRASCYWVVIREAQTPTPIAIWLSFGFIGEPSLEDLRTLDQLTQLVQIAYDQHCRTQALTHSAQHDILTGLPNRVLFESRLQMAIDRARQTQTYIGVLFIDLDRFKQVNDTFGHKTGDQLLRLVSQRLLQGLRGIDTLARFGGDEFVIVLPDIEHTSVVRNIAQRLVDLLRHPFFVDANELYVTASIGVSIYPENGLDMNSLQHNADAAMYRAKRSAGDSYQLFQTSMSVSNRERLEIETQLRYAIERQELQLYYHPQVDRHQQIRAMEVLLRWSHPQYGILVPAQFLPIAEESGLIIQIGLWCIRQVCEQIKDWQRRNISVPRACINISTTQLRNPQFIEQVQQILIETGVNPNKLELELTEHALMGEFEEINQQLQRLHDLQLRLALDNFGAGYSSIAHLQRMPIDTIKIDRSFIQAMDTGIQQVSGLALVQALMTLAHTLQKQTVAEGVETHKQFRQLQQIGCHFFQGYLFYEPLPASAIEPLLAQTHPTWHEHIVPS